MYDRINRFGQKKTNLRIKRENDDISEVMMTKGLSEDELIIIVASSAAVLALLVIISVLVCVYCCKKGKNKNKKGDITTREM